ncbi:MAG: GNAT family N-acetyltransferase [Pseudomonadota bacterium]
MPPRPKQTRSPSSKTNGTLLRKIEIRRATTCDAPALARLCYEVQAWHAATYPHVFVESPDLDALVGFFDAQIAQPDAHVFLAVASGSPAAYLFARFKEPSENLFQLPRRRLLVEHVATSAAFRRQGLATALFNQASVLAEELDCADLYLDTWNANETAHAAFEAAGFGLERRRYSKQA